MKRNEIEIFLNTLFKFETPQRDKLIKLDLEDEIYKILSTKSFRQGSVTSDIEKLFRQKISLSIKESKPITLIIAVGGFKNPNLDSAPHIDWAEVFQLSFLLKTLYRISDIYKPGLYLEFSGDSNIAVFINNLKNEWIQTYNKEFDELINIVNTTLPENIKISIKNFSEFYKDNFIEEEISKRLNKIDFNNPEILHLIENKMSHAINNFCFIGEKDFSNYSNEEKIFLQKESIVKNKLWLEIDYEKRSEYLEGGINIPVLHSKSIPGCYSIKAVKASVIPYWVGKGVLIYTKDKIYPEILSVNQYLNIKNKLENVMINPNLIKLNTIPILDNYERNRFK